MKRYIQFINMGIANCESLQEVEEWNVGNAVQKALDKNSPKDDIYIIGFRFLEKEGEFITNKSGIYYLTGVVVKEPVSDMEVFQYCKERQLPVPSFPVIKMKQPFLVVYPFEKEDCVLHAEQYITPGTKENRSVRMEQLRKNIIEYKEKVVGELRETADALEADEFSLVSLTGEPEENGVRYLNICGDDGDFGKHMKYLYACIKELEKLQRDS